MIAHIVDYLMQLAGGLGYFGIIFIVGLEYACFPIPSEVVLPFVGMGIATGTYEMVYGFTASIIGAVFGTLLAYAIGYIGGVPLLEWSKRRFPKTKKSIIALDKWIKQYGNLAVLFSRVFPLTRTYVSFLAGSQKLDLLSFMSYSALGIFAWNTALISLGYFLGNNLELIDSIMKKYSTFALIILGIGIFYLLLRNYQSKKETRRA
ncbi:MAG: DedA family protein [Zhenhengia sp.]